MKHTIRHIFKLSGLLVVSSLLIGCTDLGYPDIEVYYETFSDDVSIAYTNAFGLGSEYSAKSFKEDFYNDDTVNDYEKGSSLTSEYYEYFVVEVEKDIEVGDFGLSIKGDRDTHVLVNVFISELDPTDDENDVKAFGDPEVDEDGELIEYSDALLLNPVCSIEILCKTNEWNTASTDEWFVDNKTQKSLMLHENEFFVIQFRNNTGYGADEELTPAKFIALNLMIAAEQSY